MAKNKRKKVKKLGEPQIYCVVVDRSMNGIV